MNWATKIRESNYRRTYNFHMGSQIRTLFSNTKYSFPLNWLHLISDKKQDKVWPDRMENLI